MSNSFYTNIELENLGFKKIGENCLISRFARFYGINNIEIGNKVRIDDYCILSGNIKLGSYIHISAFCALYGSLGIDMDSFSGLSPRSTIFSAMDDFSGNYLINPMIDSKYTNVTGGKVDIGKYVQIGANTVVFPNIRIEDGVVTGAMTLVNSNLKGWNVYAGIPARVIKERNKKLLNFANKII